MLKRNHDFFRNFISLLLVPVLTVSCLLKPPAARAAEDPDFSSGGVALIITEVMMKNRAVVQDETGEFPDWIELYNNSGADLNLAGWSLSDRESKAGLVFPAFLLPADAYFVVYASGKDRPEELHAPFSLSAGETLFLKSPEGETVCRLDCPDLGANRSWALQPDGSFRECLYPTPWHENTTASYDAIQDQAEVPGPIQINEVLVSDPNERFSSYDGSDWVELKNISAESVNLGGWYLSDDADNYRKASLPSVTLAPGALTVVRGDQLGLSLDSDNESLFLWEDGSGLRDWMSLRDIPYGGSYGRMSGRNGTYFFAKASPDAENQDGRRRVSAMPTATTPDGIYDGSEPVVLDLEAAGTVYYTFDATVPTVSSMLWAGPTEIPASCVIRAMAVERNALPSRTLTLNYYIGENFSLPVLSLVSDDKVAFYGMYTPGWKGLEWSGSISLHDENGRIFSAPCGIGMHGDTSLVLPKKNLSIRFRGCYGLDELDCDIFGGGVTSFTSLVVRAGQDQSATIIRNELCENLALSASNHIIGLRNLYCVMFLDGNYSGIYALSEKPNEQHYANIAGVSRNSVVTVDTEVPRTSDLYLDVFDFCEKNDMSDPENFAHIQTLLDIDSLIDWVFIEGFCANRDLTYGNLRFCRSWEDDGRWRFMFYDLDATFSEATANHAILLHRNNVQCVQVSYLFNDLWRNPDFQDRFLSRAAELLRGPLSNESVLAEIDRLAELIDPEVARDQARLGRNYSSWKANVESLKDFIIRNDWVRHNIATVCRELHLSSDVRAYYFGDLE